MDRSIAVAVSKATATSVTGIFQRHTSPRQRPLSGSASGGRWGAEGAFPVLYLARPTASVVIEAHRHLVEPVEGMRAEMVGLASGTIGYLIAMEVIHHLTAAGIGWSMIMDLRTIPQTVS